MGLGLGENLFGVAFRFNLSPDVGDGSVGGDEKRGALDAHHLLTVHILFLEHVEELGDLFVGISEQGVRERVFFLELLLRLRSIRGDAEDGESGAGELAVMVAEAAGLGSAAGGIGARVEE